MGHIRESFMTKLTSVSWWCPPEDQTQKGALQNAFQSVPCPCESDHGLNVASAGVLRSDTVIFHGSHLMQCPSALGWG